MVIWGKGDEKDMQSIYFDHSSTTPVDPSVQRSYMQVMESFYGNPSSMHRMGMEAERLINKARELIRAQLNTKNMNVVFTASGTESNNLAVKGVAFGFVARGKHIITTQVEHSSVYETCRGLEKHFGYEVTYLKVDKFGKVSADQVAQALRKDTILVSIMHVNNELGSVQPLSEIGDILKHVPQTLFHVDAVQGLGKVELNIEGCHIDLLSASGHKFHAPKGIGFLLVKQGLRLHPLQHGGGQESGLRSGTENVPAIVAIAKAVRIHMESKQERLAHIQALRDRLMLGLDDLNDEVYANHPQSGCAPHIINVSFLGIKAEVMLRAFEKDGIYVSTRSACSSKSNGHSRVLQQVGLSEERMSSAIRISLAHTNTLDEVDTCIHVLSQIIPTYKHVMKV